MNISTEQQDRFLELFFQSAYAHFFYLTGGSALARFYFHHRESLDLDLFTQEQELDFTGVNRTVLQIAKALEWGITQQVVTDTFLQYIFADQEQFALKVDLVKDIPVHFGEIRTEGVFRVDNLENIGSNKILAVFGRTEAKDFIDLYWLINRAGMSFDHFFDLARQKDLGLTEFYFAYALQNVARIKHFPRMIQPLPWDEIVDYFQKLSRELLLRVRPDLDDV